jgi:two-component system OmpR family sensor kinase
MMRSLRVRLILWLGAAIMAATAIQFFASLRAATQEADKLFDYHMQQMALALQDSALGQTQWHALPEAGANSFEFVIQVWTEGGVRVYQPRSYRYLPDQSPLGYSTVTLDNGDWRVYAAKNDKRVIQVAQKMDARRERAMSLALGALWPAVLVSLLLFVAAWWVVTSALSPLNRIGRDLANRNADSLAPVSDEGVPREVSVLVAELNSLLARMASTLQSQQRFVADAAHELRSPLTALKLQTQTLARAKDEKAREQAIGLLHGGVDRASRLMEQLLALARQDPLSQTPGLVQVSLPACVELAVSDIAAIAASRHIGLDCGTLTDADILGDSEGLRVMIRNLLDNAVRYAPEYGTVRLELAVRGSTVSVAVRDSGAGIPAQERARVFDRFYRISGTSPSGSGLGLAIVKAIADRHAAMLELGDAPEGGLAVTVTFPLILDTSTSTGATHAARQIPANA